MRKQKACVVEVSPPKDSPFEVWFVREPACLPVRLVTRNQNQEPKLEFEVQDLITSPTERGPVVLPSKVETSKGIERLIESTLRVNQEIPKGRFQVEFLYSYGRLRMSEPREF